MLISNYHLVIKFYICFSCLCLRFFELKLIRKVWSLCSNSLICIFMICIFVCTYGIIKQEFFKMIYNFYISVDLHIDRSFILTRVICYLIKKNKLCSKYKLIPFLKIIVLYYIILYYIICIHLYIHLSTRKQRNF